MKAHEQEVARLELDPVPEPQFNTCALHSNILSRTLLPGGPGIPWQPPAKAFLLGQCSQDSTLSQDALSNHPPNVTVPKMRQTRTSCRCQQEGQRWALRLCANPACTAHCGFWKVLIPAAASSVNGASDASSPVLVYVYYTQRSESGSQLPTVPDREGAAFVFCYTSHCCPFQEPPSLPQGFSTAQSCSFLEDQLAFTCCY